MLDDATQPHDDAMLLGEEEGAVNPPAGDQGDDGQTGAETTLQPTERTYTQAEWSKRESAKDKEIAGYRQALDRAMAQQAIDRAEAMAQQDLKSVEDGTLTAEQAQAKQRERATAVQEGQRRQQEQGVLDARLATANDTLRMEAAIHIARDHGIDAGALLNDVSLTNPQLMEASALRIANEKLKTARATRESFDSEQKAGGGAAVESLSPTEKITEGLRREARKR